MWGKSYQLTEEKKRELLHKLGIIVMKLCAIECLRKMNCKKRYGGIVL